MTSFAIRAVKETSRSLSVEMLLIALLSRWSRDGRRGRGEAMGIKHWKAPFIPSHLDLDPSRPVVPTSRSSTSSGRRMTCLSEGSIGAICSLTLGTGSYTSSMQRSNTHSLTNLLLKHPTI